MQFLHCSSNIAVVLHKIKVQIVYPVKNLLGCLPVGVRPTSGGRIGQVFSHNTEYRHANTDMLIGLRFIHGESFYPSLLFFLFDW